MELEIIKSEINIIIKDPNYMSQAKLHLMNKYLNKGLLVIGGGILQIEALKLCTKLGIKTYLLDRDNKCYSKPFASEFFEFDSYTNKNCIISSLLLLYVFNAFATP